MSFNSDCASFIFLLFSACSFFKLVVDDEAKTMLCKVQIIINIIPIIFILNFIISFPPPKKLTFVQYSLLY